MKDIVNLMPFVVRVEDGREFSVYERSAKTAIIAVGLRYGCDSPVTMVIRADEPFVRHPSRLRTFLDWWES